MALVDIDRHAVEHVAPDLTTQARQALALACDVSDEQDVAAEVTRTVETFGLTDMALSAVSRVEQWPVALADLVAYLAR